MSKKVALSNRLFMNAPQLDKTSGYGTAGASERDTFSIQGHDLRGEQEVESSFSWNNDDSAPKVLEELVGLAEQARASDIHLKMTGADARLRFRLDGVMTPAHVLPPGLSERLFGRIKYLARLRTYQDSIPQDGRIDRTALGAANDLRISTYPTVTGEKVVLRLFSPEHILTLDDLGYSDDVVDVIRRFIKRTSGMLLLTGPAGSGKTTTIYACLKELGTEAERHIITIEDPVERVIPEIMQTEVNPAAGMTYAKAARHLLRQDPQVLVLGEIRDEETANLAVRTALTGHLVISTLHAGSCRGVLERMLVMCEDTHAVLTSLGLILNQRLARVFCGHCRGDGCPECINTGFKGRKPLTEWLFIDEQKRERLHKEGVEVAHPQSPLEQVGERLCDQEVTNKHEISRVLSQ
ncbi:MAG: Flp pilus assembly complex ATPase component TadA [Verrucomicrobia bacterium]|nr:Flp pilus assembly complex ATPase component TadA [Verrucomicrobiota bacterium]MCF7708801.1 Flp pilus assembly complex ATPase component TadA [Verrucomicrobiota bacterium]